MSENNNEKETRKKMVHIAFLKSEKSQIEESADELNMTISEFCRQAIFEKIRRKKHPEMFMSNTGTQMDTKILESLFTKMKDIEKNQQRILERDNVLLEMKNTLEKIALYSEKEDFTKEKETILNLLKSHPSLTQKKIIELTGFNEKIVFQVVSILVSEKKITITANGRFKLA